MRQSLQKFLINQLELSPGIVLPDTLPIKDAIEEMRKNKTGCVVTQRGKEITGVFTERDILTKVVGIDDVDWNAPLSQFTTRSPTTMMANEPLRKALYIMRKKNFRHIPIFNQDQTLKGVLSIRNVIKMLAEHFPKEVMNLPPKLNRVASTPEGG